MSKWLNNLRSTNKYYFNFFKLYEKFAEKPQLLHLFLVNKDNVNENLNILMRES